MTIRRRSSPGARRRRSRFAARRHGRNLVAGRRGHLDVAAPSEQPGVELRVGRVLEDLCQQWAREVRAPGAPVDQPMPATRAVGAGEVAALRRPLPSSPAIRWDTVAKRARRPADQKIARCSSGHGDDSPVRPTTRKEFASSPASPARTATRHRRRSPCQSGAGMPAGRSGNRGTRQASGAASLVDERVGEDQSRQLVVGERVVHVRREPGRPEHLLERAPRTVWHRSRAGNRRRPRTECRHDLPALRRGTSRPAGSRSHRRVCRRA